MALDRVREYFRQYGRENDIHELTQSIATVELAALALNVSPARIAKTISLANGDECILVVAAGDARIDNAKYRQEFKRKAKLLTAGEVEAKVGHGVGGVCPFAINEGVPVYVDISLKRFDTVFPACGSDDSAIELTCDELYDYARARAWVDVCSAWE